MTGPSTYKSDAIRGLGMATIEEQIKSLEEEIGKTQKNKATNAHIGKL